MTTNEAAVCDLLALILGLAFLAGLSMMLVTNALILINAMHERKKDGLTERRVTISNPIASKCGCVGQHKDN